MIVRRCREKREDGAPQSDDPRPPRGLRVPGRRAISIGAVGWDVAALQFSLAAHGFPSGPVDGGFGPRSAAALQRFQRWAAMTADGAAGPATLRALHTP